MQLTEVIKIAGLTSPLPDTPRLSSPRPKLKHGRRLSLLFPKSNPKCVCFLLRSISGYSSLTPFSTNFPNCSSPRESASVFADYLRSHFSVSQPKALRSLPEATFPSSAEPRILMNLTRLFARPSLRVNFLLLPPTSPRPLPLAQTTLLIPC